MKSLRESLAALCRTLAAKLMWWAGQLDGVHGGTWVTGSHGQCIVTNRGPSDLRITVEWWNPDLCDRTTKCEPCERMACPGVPANPGEERSVPPVRGFTGEPPADQEQPPPPPPPPPKKPKGFTE